MQKVIGILSGKGGVGKTVTSINLSSALREFGHDSIIVDADISSANLTVHLGLPDPMISLQDVLEGKAHIHKAIKAVPRGLKIVPASLTLEQNIVDMSSLNEVIREGLSGLTIIDAPPGFNKDIHHVMDACDEILVVTNPDIASVTDAMKVIELSRRREKNVLGVVVTRVTGKDYEVGTSEIEALCEVPIFGVIPEDNKVKESLAERIPVVYRSPNSKAAIHYKHLASNMVGANYKSPRFLTVRRILSR